MRKLGEGGTSQVFLARHKYLGIVRAIKKIPKTEVNKECYYAEINVLNKVNMKGIPMIYDVDEDYKNWYIVEEYVEGMSFSKYLENNDNDIKEILGYVCDLCVIIHSLHSIEPAGVIYRDLSPKNIIISNGEVYLVDFGNSLVLDGHTREYLMATNEYAAPEQFLDELPGVWTDVYSIGMLLQKIYKLYQTKFEGCEEDFLKIISICIEKEISGRFVSALVICDRLKYLMNTWTKMKKVISSDSENIDIYIYGCRRYAGTTHFALGLSKYLSEESINSIYIEDNSAKQIIEMVNYKNDAYCENGVYKYEKCRIRPNYGEFCMELDESYDENCRINIHDCGLYSGIKKELRGYVIVVITDIKTYQEFRFHDQIRNNMDLNILYVANFSEEKGIKDLLRQTNIDIVNMPYFENPFMLNKYIKDFYEEVTKKTIGKVLPRRQFYKKGW